MDAWKTVASRTLVADRWIRLRSDTCVDSRGRRISPYYVLEFPDWVNVVPITPSGEVVLARQYRHGIGKVLYELPCGGIDRLDADPEAAARRELGEETGYGGGEFRETCRLYVNPANHDNVTYGFLATGVEPSIVPHPDENEEVEIVLKPLAEVKRMLLADEFKQALHAAALFHAFRILENPP